MMRLGVGEESAGDRFYERQGFVTVGGQGFVLGGEDQTDFVVVRALGDDECAAPRNIVRRDPYCPAGARNGTAFAAYQVAPARRDGEITGSVRPPSGGLHTTLGIRWYARI
jgi:hypothetical protein